MKLTDFYSEVARRSDTEGTSISAAETRRVLATAFDTLNELNVADLADVLSKGLAQAEKRKTKKK